MYTIRRTAAVSKQTAVRISDETYERLQALAAQTGRTVTYYIREAIEKHLEDLEDIYLAEQALERLRRDEDQIVSGEEFWRELAD